MKALNLKKLIYTEGGSFHVNSMVLLTNKMMARHKMKEKKETLQIKEGNVLQQ